MGSKIGRQALPRPLMKHEAVAAFIFFFLAGPDWQQVCEEAAV